MTEIGPGFRFVRKDEPVFSVFRDLKLPLRHGVGLFYISGLRAGTDGAGAGNVDFIISKVNLHRMNVIDFAEIKLQPFISAGRGSLPPGLHVFFHCLLRLMPGHKRRCRSIFADAQQHPGRFCPRILTKAGAGHWPVAVPLVAKELPVSIKTCRPYSDTTLKVMINRDAHGGGVPPIALHVLHGGAMPGTGQESARLIGVRVVVRQNKRSERTITDINAVGVCVILGTGGCILEIISALVLVHPGALNIGPFCKHPPDQRFYIGREAVLRNTLAFDKCLKCQFHLFRGGGQRAVVFSNAFITDLIGMV